MKTAIIILNYNNNEDTINCIRSVEQYNTAPAKIIVVDNGSAKTHIQDEMTNWITSNYPNNSIVIEEKRHDKLCLPYITYLKSKTNDGYAQGNNKGLALAYKDDDIDYIMILNNDILFIEDIIPVLIKNSEDIKDCGIISPLLLKRDAETIDYNCARRLPKLRNEFFKHLFLCRAPYNFDQNTLILKNKPALLNKKIVPIELPSGSCMLLRKSLAMSIGLFDPNTFLYCEENILYIKISQLNLKNYILPEIRCIHLGAQTMKKTAANTFTLKCGYDSMQYFLRTYTNAPFTYRLFIRCMNYIELKLVELKKK